MWAGIRYAAAAWVLGWIAAAAVAQERAEERSLAVDGLIKAEENALQQQEQAMAFRKLVSDYAELQTEMAEKEQALKALGESLAAAQGEAAMFRKRCQELQQQPRQTNAPPATVADTVKLNSDLADATAALQRSEQERNKLLDQLQRLNTVMEEALSGPEGLSVVRRAQALAEAERVKRTLAAARPPGAKPEPQPVQEPVAPTMESAQIVSLNWSLQLAVVNLGSEQGVRLGMPFAVMRGDRVIARLKVVEVRKKISGAVMETMDRGNAVKVGDRVRLTKS
jgi:hypothetical protein